MVMIFVYRCGPIVYGGRRVADTGRTGKGMLYARTNGMVGLIAGKERSARVQN
jgi:hypothetical protein